jgi:hypothetical protein
MKAAKGANLKSIPKFKNEAEERAFWESHDTTPYVDWSRARIVSFPRLRPSRSAPEKKFSRHPLR